MNKTVKHGELCERGSSGLLPVLQLQPFGWL